MHALNLVLVAILFGAAGGAGGFFYARHTEAPPPPALECPPAPAVTETTWSVDKVSAAIAEARNLPAGPARSVQLFEAVRRVAPKEERKVIERLPLQQHDGVTEVVRDRLLDRWTMDDPPNAMAYANRIADAHDREHAARVVANAWTQIDPIAALAGAPPPLVFSAWVATDPVAAVKREYSMPLVGDAHPHDAMTAWIAHDPDGATKWVRENPTAPEAAAYVGQIVATRMGDPQKAKQWVNELPAGDVRSNAQGALALGIAQKTPMEALRLIAGMNAGPARANAAAEVIMVLKRSEREDEAEEWLDSAPLNADERRQMNQRMNAAARSGR